MKTNKQKEEYKIFITQDELEVFKVFVFIFTGLATIIPVLSVRIKFWFDWIVI